MNISVISFTENGIHLGEELAKAWDGGEIRLYTKYSAYPTQGAEEMPLESINSGNVGTEKIPPEKSLAEWTGEQMQEKYTLLFIGACGIAVRAIAPHIIDKLQDSPVLVMDEKGEYVIPILSGHMGGANETALQIAQKLGAVPVITTATDINHKFAVDLFAKKNGLSIINKEGIAKVSAKALSGEELVMSIEPGHLAENIQIPEKIRIVDYPPGQPADIVISTEEMDFQAHHFSTESPLAQSFPYGILLKPKQYVLGMGCTKGKETEKIEDFIRESMEEANISLDDILLLASIEQKKEEEGFLIWSRKYRIPFRTYTAEQLKEAAGDFHGSDFVKARVGVDNVCERAAVKACEHGGKLIYEKHAKDGMTIAIAKREWRVSFDEK